MSLSFEDLRAIIISGKKKEFAKAMFEVLTEKQNNLPDFYDFYGKLIKEDIIFTLSKCYFLFRNLAQKVLSINKLWEMDKILMENYALSKHEPIEYCFFGQIFSKATTSSVSGIGTMVFGVIYITKLRLIGLGSFSQSPSITGAIAGAISGKSNESFRQMMQKKMGDDFSESELTKFNHFYPINNPYKIKKKKNAILYTADLEYEKKGKPKTKKFKIVLKPFKEENVDNKEKLLNKIESLLLSYQ